MNSYNSVLTDQLNRMAFLEVCRHIPGGVSPHSWRCVATFLEVCRHIPGVVSSHSWRCVVTFLELCRHIPGDVSSHSWSCVVTFLEMFYYIPAHMFKQIQHLSWPILFRANKLGLFISTCTNTILYLSFRQKLLQNSFSRSLGENYARSPVVTLLSRRAQSGR